MCPAATLTSPEMEMGTILNILGILIGISRKMEYLPLKRRTDGKIHIRVFGTVIPEHEEEDGVGESLAKPISSFVVKMWYA